MTREEYLNLIWNPYPAMPSQCVAAGRIHAIGEKEGRFEVSLIRDQKLQKFEFSNRLPFFDFLIEGDIVAVLSTNEILLLAPKRKSLPSLRYDKNLLSQWNLFVCGIKVFFAEQQFLEIKTPTLVSCPGTEPSLDVFGTKLKVGSREKMYYLPTSPELHLKKALTLGAEKIFEIAPCFRNGEITEKHQPEFLMLEWYRAYDNLKAIKRDVESLVRMSAKILNVEGPRKVLSHSVADLFKMYCDFDLRPNTSKEQLQELAGKLGVDVHSAESIDDFFFLIFMDKIESKLPPDELIFVEKYPPYQAALARLTEDGWGDRFEVYWKGLELANAFHELNDPAVQVLRSNEDIEKKKMLNKEEIPLDKEFFQCLEAGMPPSGGIALGIERLFMALTNQTDISVIQIFPKSYSDLV